MTVSKEDLLKARFGLKELDVPGVGTVKIRSLSRAQALELRDKEIPVSEMEAKLLVWAMVEPALTLDEVKQWQANTPAGELQPITEEIARISGMVKSSPKDAMLDFREH